MSRRMDGMEWQGSEALADDFLPPHLSHYPKYLHDYHLPYAHPRRRCITAPPVYTTHTRSLFQKDWEMDILKRALQDKEHDFSGRSPGS
jgi:hypothetical protein